MAERRGTKSDGVKRRGWCAAWPTRIAATLMLLMLSRVVCAQVACRYSLTVIEAPPAGLPSPTHAYAISPNGRYVVGQFSPGALGNDRAFVYDTQTSVFRAIPQVNGSSTSHAWDVSDTGVVVGEAYGLTGAWGYMFDLNTNQFTTLLKPLNVGGRCRITGINSSNQVCGTRTIGSKGDPDHPTTAFIWSAETGYQDLGLIEGWSSEAIDIAEDGGVVVGRGFGLGAFYWDGHILTPVPGLPGSDDVTPMAIGNGGRIVGVTYFVSEGHVEAFDYRDGIVHALPLAHPSYLGRQVQDLNSQGVIAGCSYVVDNVNMAKPCVWFDDDVLDVSMAFTAPAGTIVRYLAGIADNYMLVAQGQQGSHVVSFVLTPIPPAAGDANCDGLINHEDLLAIVSHWGPSQSPADLTRDGVVGVADLLAAILNWTH